MIDSLHMPVCRLKESRISPFPFFEAFKYVLSSIPNNSFFVFIVIIPTTLTGIMSYTEVFTDFICELLGRIDVAKNLLQKKVDIVTENGASKYMKSGMLKDLKLFYGSR